MRAQLLAGSRLVPVALPDDATLVAAPPPLEPLADVGAATRDAFRYPLAGAPLEALVTRGGRATLVVEPALLPVPASDDDPRP